MRLTHVVLLAASQILLGLFGCTRSPQASSPLSAPLANPPELAGNPFKHFDPASLVEVKSFSKFPDALKATIRAGWAVPKDAESAAESPGGGMTAAHGRGGTGERSASKRGALQTLRFASEQT